MNFKVVFTRCKWLVLFENVFACLFACLFAWVFAWVLAWVLACVWVCDCAYVILLWMCVHVSIYFTCFKKLYSSISLFSFSILKPAPSWILAYKYVA